MSEETREKIEQARHRERNASSEQGNERSVIRGSALAKHVIHLVTQEWRSQKTDSHALLNYFKNSASLPSSSLLLLVSFNLQIHSLPFFLSLSANPGAGSALQRAAAQPDAEGELEVFRAPEAKLLVISTQLPEIPFMTSKLASRPATTMRGKRRQAIAQTCGRRQRGPPRESALAWRQLVSCARPGPWAAG